MRKRAIFSASSSTPSPGPFGTGISPFSGARGSVTTSPRQLAAARDHPDAGAGVHTEPARVARMHGHLEARRQLEQALDAAGERAAVPVVEEPAGVEDEREIGVRKLGGFDRLQGGDEARPA